MDGFKLFATVSTYNDMNKKYEELGLITGHAYSLFALCQVIIPPSDPFYYLSDKGKF